jgi:hypothetical protein
MKRLQLNGTNPERLQQILAEAERVKGAINAISRSNLDRSTKKVILDEHEEYLETLRKQFLAVKETVNKELIERRKKEEEEKQAEQKKKLEQQARLLNLYKLRTVLPEGMYDELPPEHKAIVSPYARKDGSIGYSIDPSKLTGIAFTINGHDYTCQELYEFLTSRHALFTYTNWCYVAPEHKITIYNAFKELIDSTGLPEDIKIYRSLHRPVEF